jgi:hypothetical protein
MNQTKKRLSIINLAISITDIETIQLQILQLGPLRTDEKIQEIIAALKAENYAQAQGLITTYIETPMNEILQRTFQKERENRKIQDNNTIDEFNLFTEPEDSSEIKTLDLDDMIEISDEVVEENPKKVQKNIDFDSLLNIDADDILPNNIKLDTSHTSSNTFWDEPEELNMQTDDIPKDTFFDTQENITEAVEEGPTDELYIENIVETTENSIEKILSEEPIYKEVTEEIIEEPLKELYSKEECQEEEKIETFEEEIQEEIEELSPQKQDNETETKNTKYKAIPYIDQKFKNMHVQYPPVQETLEIFPSVTEWLRKISHEGYGEADIEEIINKIDALGIEHKEEAAQLLLITAATESKYAQFRLARTLYKGEILQKNLPEAFTLINRLATNDDYPEAICDLAQFYEHGIGIDKDKKKAELLYEEAMNAGIKRAVSHYERTKKQNSGLFSFLKK